LFAGLGAAIGLGGGRLRRVQAGSEAMSRRVFERQAHLQSILDTVPDAMIVIDTEGIIQSFSPAAEQLFGWTRDEVLGRNVNLLMPAEHAEAHDSYIQRYLTTGEARIIGCPRAVEARAKTGAGVPVQLYVGETDTAGAHFFTGFLQDLTERQASQRRLQAMQAELLHTSRLSALGEIAAALAHELNQPLSAISNYLTGGRRLLQDENPESRALTALDKAAGQSLRAGEIIRRLRTFIATGENEAACESLKALIEEAATLGLVGVRDAGITVVTRWDSEADLVWVDRIQIQQVVVNLLRNAVEAMESSPMRVLTVSTAAGGTSAEGGGEDMVEVQVADTGPGIAPEVADRLFQPFTTTKPRRGMGVGLSICRTIIEGHGGRIWVEPNSPCGAVFRFTVPRCAPGLEAPAPAETSGVGP
jgi:two-component system sensor kinase FixL